MKRALLVFIFLLSATFVSLNASENAYARRPAVDPIVGIPHESPNLNITQSGASFAFPNPEAQRHLSIIENQDTVVNFWSFTFIMGLLVCTFGVFGCFWYWKEAEKELWDLNNRDLYGENVIHEPPLKKSKRKSKKAA